eukprot:1717683-Prymnesium_polylepis.1
METFQKSLDHLDGSDDERHRMIVLDDREDAWDATSRGHVLQIPAFRYFRDGGGMQPLSKEVRPVSYHSNCAACALMPPAPLIAQTMPPSVCGAGRCCRHVTARCAACSAHRAPQPRGGGASERAR